MKSRTTAQFRKAFANLPPEVQQQTRKAYRQFKANYAEILEHRY